MSSVVRHNCYKHEIKQIVIKDNIPHPNHRPDEGRRDGYQNHCTIHITNSHRSKTIIQVTM